MKCYVYDDPELTIRKLPAKSVVFYYAIQTELSKRKKKRKYGGLVPHALSDSDNASRAGQALPLLKFYGKSFDWLDPIVSGDEKCVLHDNHVRYEQ